MPPIFNAYLSTLNPTSILPIVLQLPGLERQIQSTIGEENIYPCNTLYSVGAH
jgi:hypothetical protein